MATPRASVVVPVYNTEAWLGDALTSIDRQPGRSTIEVIIIDDGSTDSSSEIAQDYARRSPQTRYVRQDNAGLGAARNHGVRLATGDYLAFLDSDDLYPDSGLEHLISIAGQAGAGIAVGDMHGFPARPSPPWRAEIVGPTRTIASIGQAPLLVGNPSACNKVFARDFVAEVGAEFTEGSAFEDVLFTLPLLLRSPRTVLSPELVYLYRQRGNGSSIMDSRFQPAKIMQHLTILEQLVVGATDVDEASMAALRRWIAYMQLHYAWRAAGTMDDAQLAEFTRRMAVLLADIPVQVAAEFSPHPHAGLRAVALYEQDPTGVRRPTHTGAVRLRGGQLYLDHPNLERYRDLLRVPTPTVTVTRIRRGDPASGESIRLTGRCGLPGPGGKPGAVRADLMLEVGDNRLRLPLVVVADDRADDLRWQVDVPLDGLPRGRYALRVVARDQGAELALPPTPGAPGTRAALTVRGRAVWVAPGRRGLRLVVSDPVVTAAAAPARWSRLARHQAERAARRGVRAARQGRQRFRRLTGR